MKLKKRHFERLKEITNGLGGTLRPQLDSLISDIESVQKPKEEFSFIDIDQLQKNIGNIRNIQEKPLKSVDVIFDRNRKGVVHYVTAAGNIFDEHRKAVDDCIKKEGESMVAASTDDSTEFKGGLRDVAVDYFKKHYGVNTVTEPNIGDVGYFNLGNPKAPIVYGRMRNYTGNKFQDTHGNWYVGFSKTPPELK